MLNIITNKPSRVTFILCLALCSCSANLAQVSSGHIGCPESEIQITEDKSNYFGTRSWLASCRGKRFFCSVAKISQNSSSLTCTPEIRSN